MASSVSFARPDRREKSLEPQLFQKSGSEFRLQVTRDVCVNQLRWENRTTYNTHMSLPVWRCPPREGSRPELPFYRCAEHDRRIATNYWVSLVSMCFARLSSMASNIVTVFPITKPEIVVFSSPIPSAAAQRAPNRCQKHVCSCLSRATWGPIFLFEEIGFLCQGHGDPTGQALRPYSMQCPCQFMFLENWKHASLRAERLLAEPSIPLGVCLC